MATTTASNAFANRSMRHVVAGRGLGGLGGALLSLFLLGCAGGAPEIDGGGGNDSGSKGCANAASIFKDPMHNCTTICHLASAAPTYGGFDMTTPGWEKRLVGNGPPDNAPPTNVCKGKKLVYLQAGVQPATGLFLDKLKPNPPCGVPMPQLMKPLTASELDCVQRWANDIVAGGTGQ